jgi:TetR/AcrR family transcriptional regulator, hemagglutinin/protease regulatory protein
MSAHSPPPPPRTRARRLDPQNRRAQLLECAIRVFARRGLGRGGHAEVAKDGRVSVATVFSYFRTRQDLLAAVLEHVAAFYDEMAEVLSDTKQPAPDGLLQFALAFGHSVDENVDYARVLLFWSTAILEDTWPSYLEWHGKMTDRLRAAIARGQSKHEIDPGVDAENAALLCVGSAHLVAQMKFAKMPPAKVARFQQAILQAALGTQVKKREKAKKA